MSAFINLSEFEKGVVEELSVLTDLTPIKVREVIELLFLRQVDALMTGSDINIPFLGKMRVIYEGEEFVSGQKVAQVTTLFSPSTILKRIVGDIKDGESDMLYNLMKRKISSELKSIIAKE